MVTYDGNSFIIQATGNKGYYQAEIITTVKSFIVQSKGSEDIFPIDVVGSGKRRRFMLKRLCRSPFFSSFN
jgi:hypothetical protein